MKLRKVFTMKNPRVKYNVNFLKDKATKDQFNITLSNKFQILEELDNIEDQWSQIQDMINNTCEEILGRKSHTQKEWITPGTLRKVQKRKQKKGAINCSRTRKERATAQALEYNKAHKAIRCSAHLVSCSAVVVRTFPFLSLICWLVCLKFPASCLVVSYRFFIFFMFAASSACAARFSYTLLNFFVSFVVF
jgi:hypothetical protein